MDRKSFLEKARSVAEKVVNAAIFYIIWVACIVTAAQGRPYVGVALSVALLALHFVISRCRLKDFVLMSVFIVAGLVVDSLYIAFNFVEYKSPNVLFPSFSPLWILAIWAVFGVSLNHSMWWLKKRYFLAALLGAWGGTASYVAGERLGAAVFLKPYPVTVAVLATVWFFSLPAAMWIAVKLDEKIE